MSGGCSSGVWLDRQAHPDDSRAIKVNGCMRPSPVCVRPTKRTGASAECAACRLRRAIADSGMTVPAFACPRSANGQHVTRCVCPGRWEVRPACCRRRPAANIGAGQALRGARGGTGQIFTMWHDACLTPGAGRLVDVLRRIPRGKAWTGCRIGSICVSVRIAWCVQEYFARAAGTRSLHGRWRPPRISWTDAAAQRGREGKA